MPRHLSASVRYADTGQSERLVQNYRDLVKSAFRPDSTGLTCALTYFLVAVSLTAATSVAACRVTSLASRVAGNSWPMTDSRLAMLLTSGCSGAISPNPVVVRVDRLKYSVLPMKCPCPMSSPENEPCSSRAH